LNSGPAVTLPNLIIPGAAKSGTTTLHEALDQHPDIFMSGKKEPHFFSRPPSDARLARYEELFDQSAGHAVRGESSTSYLVIPEAARRIKTRLEDPRLIVVLRNPVDRVRSHFEWLRSLGLEHRPLREAFLADRDQTPDIENGVLETGNYRYYYAHSAYGSNLSRFLEFFTREMFHVITFERLSTDFAVTVGGCFRFLGVSRIAVQQPIHENPTAAVSGTRARMRFALRLALKRFPRFRFLLAPYRLTIGKLVDRMDTAGIDETRDSLSPEDREWLADHLTDEVQLLRRATGYAFAEWSQDFPQPVDNGGRGNEGEL
jgi:hypothetical protein